MRASLAVLGLFGLLTLGLTWPVIPHLGDRLPGTATWAFDESTFAWNIWYFKHALLDLHTNLLHSELIWYPLGIDLILYTYNFFNAIIALPLQVAFNLPLASNVTLLLATALSGFGTYLLTCYVLRSPYSVQAPPALKDLAAGLRLCTPHSALRTPQYTHLAALLAGVIYAFASNRAVYAALGHYDMVTTQWLPFYVLYLLKTLREPRLKNAVLAGLFFAMAALAEMIFASLLALLTLIVLLAMWRELPDYGPWQTTGRGPFDRLRAGSLARCLWLGTRWAALGRLALAAVVALLIWSPALGPIAREFMAGDYTLTGWGESVKLSADLVGLVTPTDLNLILRPWSASAELAGEPGGTPLKDFADPKGGQWAAALRAVEEGKGRFSDINTVFLGYATLGLALLGAWRAGGRLKVWSWSAFTFGLLTLGPLLQINGRYRFSLDNLLPEGTTFPLPFALLHFIPFINANRAPNRNSVILMLALAVLAGYGAAWLLEQIAKCEASPLVYLSTGLFATLVIIEHLAIPLPTTDARVPEVYQQIAREPGDFAILQLPLGWRNSFGVLGSEQTQLQYFQTVYSKPMIGGNISRAPAFNMEYFRRIPLFRAITDLEMYREVAPETDAAARAQAGALMALYNVRYFVTTPPIPGRYPYQDTWQRTEAYALDVLPLEKPAVWEQDGYRAYRVVQSPVPFPFRLDLGTHGIEPYVGDGWDLRADEQPYGRSAIWATDTTADLYLPLDEPHCGAKPPLGVASDRNSPSVIYTLRFAIAPLTYDGAPAQRVSISFNGWASPAKHILSPGWQIIEVEVPDFETRCGPNHIRLTFDWAASPRAVFSDPASRAEIGTTGVASPVNLDVHSFSEAFISTFAADGTETKASVGRRGYDVAVIHPRTGKVLDMRGFDTAANAYEADRLAVYLARIRRGQIVVLATQGDATAHLTPSAIAALRGLGSRIGAAAELSGQAHALVGVQGTTPGTAAEVIAPGDAFLRIAGDFRALAAAVDWVELGP